MQRADIVDPGERAAACTNGKHLNAGKADRVAEFNSPILGDAGFSPLDQRYVATRTTHIQANRILVTTQHSDMAAGDSTGGNA